MMTLYHNLKLIWHLRISTVVVAGEEFTREISTNTSQAEEICQTPRSPAVEEQLVRVNVGDGRTVSREGDRDVVAVRQRHDADSCKDLLPHNVALKWLV
ncbi:unnamed protein product [Leptidea sinapis]|uniref:Uncharacterized protein n=1 Tax=Leptidea sinapis TaxID=189913 RepID=A0A5E4PSI0_9NEOP|nr:unnamed protein product [Leptidea sinapis]